MYKGMQAISNWISIFHEFFFVTSSYHYYTEINTGGQKHFCEEDNLSTCNGTPGLIVINTGGLGARLG
jgi:hypothetical protein